MSMKGGCLCGSVRYELTVEPVLTGLCHCLSCQKLSGGAFSVNLAVPRAGLRIEGATLKTFHDTGESGQPVQRLFCDRCGSPIASFADTIPELAFVKAGTLDDTSGLAPTMEIWCETAQPWVVIDPARAQAARNPKG